MAIFSWFDTGEVDEFARALAQDLAGRFPPPPRDRKITPQAMRNIHEAIVARAAAFARNHKLNWYKKAHLGNTFKWALHDSGYDSEFVDAMTHDLLVAITPVRQKKASAPARHEKPVAGRLACFLGRR